MVRYLMAVPLIMHGLAHGAGFAGSWTSNPAGFSDRPWILSQGVTLHSPVGRAFGLLWLVALIGLVGTGLGLVFGQEWWPSLAMVAAVVSLVVIVPWWNTVPPGARAGAVFDLLVIIALLSPWRERILDLIR